MNIALNKPAYQSSVKAKTYSTDPGNIVDGNLERNLNHGSCSITEDDDMDPWWMVDLGRPYQIHNFTIVNRGDWKSENEFISGLLYLQIVVMVTLNQNTVIKYFSLIWTNKPNGILNLIFKKVRR